MAAKEPIRLRKRKMPTGNISLYLDIYIDGKRSYEYLKLYLSPEKTKSDRDKNKQTIQLAEAIRAKRIVNLQNGTYGFDSAYRQDTNFLDYYRSMCEARHGNIESRGNWGNWYSALKHLERFCDPKMTFKDVTSEWLNKFKNYLDKDARSKRPQENDTSTTYRHPLLSQNTKHSYFNKVCACINQAFEDRILPHNPLRGVERFKEGENKRVYLTIEEIKKMAIVECRTAAVKDVFLFSCLTGLRKSDIEKMTWSEIEQQGEFARIVFKQKKTGGQEYLDISPQAARYLTERGPSNSLVFPNFRYNWQTNTDLKMWALKAGIQKDITFHSARHTFAVMMLDLGAEIYTVSKLLGHKDLKTTQIYAKVLDKKKQEAVSLIPDISFSEK